MFRVHLSALMVHNTLSRGEASDPRLEDSPILNSNSVSHLVLLYFPRLISFHSAIKSRRLELIFIDVWIASDYGSYAQVGC
jgi:hypothetical protein